MEAYYRLTQEDLDEMRCENPTCRHDSCTLMLAPRCHPTAAVLLAYKKAEGVLYVTCGRCRQPVTEIEVAP